MITLTLMLLGAAAGFLAGGAAGAATGAIGVYLFGVALVLLID